MKIPKELTTVTPLSKAVALFLFVALPVITFYIGTRVSSPEILENNSTENTQSSTKKESKKPTPTDVPQERFTIVDGCSIQGCLFNDSRNKAVVGFADIRGYFTTYNKKDWGDVDVTCTALTVKDGNKKLIESLLQWVKDGNTVNKANEKGELILNIGLDDLDPADQQKIKSSTELTPIDLSVIRTLPQPRSAGACASFVNIIKVK